MILEHQGRFTLFATTRDNTLFKIFRRDKLWVKPDETRKEILGACLATHEVQIRHTGNPSVPNENLSKDLEKTLYRDNSSECMAFPLLVKNKMSEASKNEDGKTALGLIFLQNPRPLLKKRRNKKLSDKRLKESQLFTSESFRFARELGAQIQRLVQMVRIADKQEWLINQMVHSLGQPL